MRERSGGAVGGRGGEAVEADGEAGREIGLDPADAPAATVRLLAASGLGPRTLARLRDACGGDDARVVRALAAGDAGALGPARIVGPALAALGRALAAVDVAAVREEAAAAGARLVPLEHPAYPALLAVIPDPPPALWIRGVLPGDRPGLAIVGARRASAYGLAQAERFAAAAVRAGLVVVSGGALGIDAAAHRAALRAGGATVAVLGSGLARPSPLRHRGLFDEIVAAGGAVVSEHAPAVTARPGFFPRRNRIVSGLAVGVLVVEAARRSGSLITARVAAEDQGRAVMAVPGRVDARGTAGVHGLVRRGGAALVHDPADLLEELEDAGHLVAGATAASGRDATDTPRHDGGPPARDDSARHLDRAEATAGAAGRRLLEVLGSTGAESAEDAAARTLGDVARALGRPVHEVAGLVTRLELAGLVERDASGLRARGG